MRDFKDPETLSAELGGERADLSNETIANALFAIETYLERISDNLLDIAEPARKEVETA